MRQETASLCVSASSSHVSQPSSGLRVGSEAPGGKRAQWKAVKRLGGEGEGGPEKSPPTQVPIGPKSEAAPLSPLSCVTPIGVTPGEVAAVRTASEQCLDMARGWLASSHIPSPHRRGRGGGAHSQATQKTMPHASACSANGPGGRALAFAAGLGELRFLPWWDEVIVRV